MATETTDYRAVLAFIRQVEAHDCLIADPALPSHLPVVPSAISLEGGLSTAYDHYCKLGRWCPSYRIFASGWMSLDGVMILTEKNNAENELPVTIAATNERALRDLLLAFPRGLVGRFCYSAPWMLTTLEQVLSGVVRTDLEAYFVTEGTFKSVQHHQVKRLDESDYGLLFDQWGGDHIRGCLARSHKVYACLEDGELVAACFQRLTSPWWYWVEGVQTQNYCEKGYPESVYSLATQDVLGPGRYAAYSTSVEDDPTDLAVVKRLGYRPFYRARCYRGIKRGSGSIESFDSTIAPPNRRYPNNSSIRNWREDGLHPQPRRNRPHPAVANFRELLSIKGRTERRLLSVEEPVLVERALADGLPVTGILYTQEASAHAAGPALLKRADEEHIPHHRVSKGVMGTVTTTRPLPWIIAAVHLDVGDVADVQFSPEAILLIIDRVANPANLGMLMRTADASGVEAVILFGPDNASPFHKHCVRAARGAVGRLPLYICDEPIGFLRRLKTNGLGLVGAAVQASTPIYHRALSPPVALVVGNETEGVRPAVLGECTNLVHIPMSPGQSSLNVGVAAGVLLYELVRVRFGDT